ncbi:Glycine betaine-binding periplasmic protein precursor [compost metagenome]
MPFSALPSAQGVTDTQQPNGKNYGFVANRQHIVANKQWVAKNPAAGKLFELMKLSVNDINAQNNRMFLGENKPADIDRHTEGWIRAHQATFDDWIAQSLAAASR